MIELTWKERVLGLPMCTALVEAKLLRNFSDTSSREHCKQNRIHNYNIYPPVKKNPATPQTTFLLSQTAHQFIPNIFLFKPLITI